MKVSKKRQPNQELESQEHNEKISSTIFRTSHGNTLRVIFEYPKENPPNYIADITHALNYAGVFKNIQKPENDAIIEK